MSSQMTPIQSLVPSSACQVFMGVRHGPGTTLPPPHPAPVVSIGCHPYSAAGYPPFSAVALPIGAASASALLLYFLQLMPPCPALFAHGPSTFHCHCCPSTVSQHSVPRQRACTVAPACAECSALSKVAWSAVQQPSTHGLPASRCSNEAGRQGRALTACTKASLLSRGIPTSYVRAPPAVVGSTAANFQATVVARGR